MYQNVDFQVILYTYVGYFKTTYKANACKWFFRIKFLYKEVFVTDSFLFISKK